MTHLTRRAFVSSSIAAGASLAALSRLARADEPKPAGAAPAPSPAKLKILVLGGTAFLGPQVVEAAMARGHQVTLFNRGKTRPDLFPDLEKLRGDRDPKKDEGLKALEGDRTWDAVVDNSGYYPRMVAASADLLCPRIKQYVYISSISAFKEAAPPGSDESYAVAVLEDPTVETMGDGYANYGGLKALCEQAVEKACPGRATNIRPGFIVGPGDPTGRFCYWPLRAREGGQMLAPGTPSDPLQWIDVRDLATWIVRCIEERTMGVFLATGPQTSVTPPGTIGDVIDGSIAVAKQDGPGTSPGPTPVDTTAVWVPADFLETQGVGPGPLPIWIPPVGDYAGFHRWNNGKAVAAGLTFRPLADTLRGINAWVDTLPKEKYAKVRGGLPREKEAAILKAWSERSGK